MSTILYLCFPESSRPKKKIEVSWQKEVIIGRATKCEINLSQYYVESPRVVSGYHCKIYYQNDHFVIEDLDSTNGTWVNGLRIRAHQPRILSDEDVIKLANRSCFQIEVQIMRPEDTEPIPLDPPLDALLKKLQEGRDVMLLGVPGMGKTSLMSDLIAKKETKQFKRHWPDHQSFLFCRLDALVIGEMNLPAFFGPLIRTTKSAFESWPDKIKDGDELLAGGKCSLMQMRDAVVTTIQSVERQLGKGIIFLIDHFDDLYPKLPPKLFWVLTEIKRLQPQVMYVIAMRNEFDKSKQHIKQFLRVIEPPNYYWLPAMSEDELKGVISRYDLSEEQIAKSIELGGRQPRLTALVASVLEKTPKMAKQSADLIRQLLDNSLIKDHCGQIWNSLSTEEQEALSSVACAEPKMRRDVQDHLIRKKRLLIDEDLRLKSPLFTAYVRSLQRQPAVLPSPPSLPQPPKVPPKEPTVRDASGKEIRIDRKSIPVKHLTKYEQKLLIYMHSKAGQICKKDEFWKEVWGYDPNNPPADASITRLISNLRQKLNQISPGAGKDYIKTSHGLGYWYSASR